MVGQPGLTAERAVEWRESPPWLVTVRTSADEDAAPVGAGFLAPDGTVVTCAHVVRKPTPPQRPDTTVWVHFRYAESHAPIAATVADDGWFPATADGDGDIAVLRLAVPPPSGARPAPLARTRPTVDRHALRAIGFPSLHPGGLPADLEAGGFADRIWLVMTPRLDWGPVIAPGYSGTPVWDRDLGAVIGLVASRESGKDGGGRTAYAITTEALLERWPVLVSHVPAVTMTADARARINAALGVRMPAGTDRLPRLSEIIRSDLGIQPSQYDSETGPGPYVARTVDAALDQAYATRRLVVLVGSNGGGKSRTLYEMLRRSDDPAVIIPASVADLAVLASLPVPLGSGRTVVWLDGSTFLTPYTGVTTAVLDQLDPGCVVVAAADFSAWEALGKEGTDRATRALRARIGEPVWLFDELTPEERAEAAVHYPDANLHDVSLGAHMTASLMLVDRWRTSYQLHRVEWALIQAALDWHRAGIGRPVSRAALCTLAEAYLPQQTQPGVLEAALHDAIRPQGSCPVAPLREVAGGYRVYPYMVDAAAGAGLPQPATPDAVWDHLVDHCGPAELLMVAQTATERDRRDVALRALDRAEAATDDPTAAQWAALLGGLARYATGDTDRASESFRRAAASPLAEVGPLARAHLALSLMSTGDLMEARGLLEELVNAEFDDPDVDPLAQTTLARLLMNEQLGPATADLKSRTQPRDTDLEAALSSVAGTAWRQIRPLAQAGLGAILVNFGETTRAQELLEIAAASPSSAGAMAQATLGVVLVDSDPVRAAQLLDAAAENSDPGVRFQVRLGRSMLAATQDLAALDIDRLLDDLAADMSVTELAQAADALGDACGRGGDPGRARIAYERAIACGDPFWTPTAQTDLATVAYAEGRFDEARRLLETAATAPMELPALRALDLLADLLRSQDEFAEARAAYQKVIDSGNGRWAPIAQIDLAVMLRPTEPETAAQLLRDAAAADNRLQALRARDLRGDWYVDDGDLVSARQEYGAVVATRDPTMAPVSRFSLAILDTDADDVDSAQAHFEVLIAGTSVLYRDRARVCLGLIVYETDPEYATELLRAAAESPIVDCAALAGYLLARIALEDGRDEDALGWLEGIFHRLTDEEDILAVGAYRALARSRLARGSGESGTAAVDDVPDLVRYGSFFFSEGEDGIGFAHELLTEAHERAGDATRPAVAAELGRARLSLASTPAELREAAGLLRTALDTTDSAVAALAQLTLAQVLFRLDRRAEATELAQAVVAAQDTEHAPDAHLLLGRIADISGDTRAAREHFERAAADGPWDVKTAAREELRRIVGGLPDDLPPITSPRPRRRRQATRRPARASGPYALAPAVTVLLGRVAIADGAAAEAQAWWTVAAHGDDETSRADAAGLLAMYELRSA